MSADWRPTASAAALRARARMLAEARAFFASGGLLEVETPLLGAASVTDPQIESLRVRVAGADRPMFLGTSPEYAMKRLLAAGLGDIYQVCKAFRDGERGRWHNPEFTLIEWYRTGFDDEALMSETEALLGRLLAPHRPLAPAQRLGYAEALRLHAGVDPGDGADRLARAARNAGVHCDAQLDHDARLDLLMGLVVGPRLGRDGRPCFIRDYPPSQASLARIRPGQPPVAARFELYLDGIELANGFHELGNAAEQRVRFDADLERRRQLGREAVPVDDRLLAALAAGLPDCAGVALGFDRVVALALGAASLEAVIAFPLERA